MKIFASNSRWKWPRALVTLMIMELAGTIATLALFSIAQPNLFRTRLWQVGYDQGFNSNPAQILYAYANHRDIPKIPFVWTETLTDLNVAVSVLSMFILLVKVVMFVMNIWYPLLGGIISALMSTLWIVSMYGQMGPDYNDAQHPSHLAWYICHSCDAARSSGNYHYCQLAKGTFAATVYMSLIFLLNTALAIYSIITPNPEKKQNLHHNHNQHGQEHELHIKINGNTKKKLAFDHRDDSCHDWEMTPVSNTLESPLYTPRTLAFNTLDRQIPPVIYAN